MNYIALAEEVLKKMFLLKRCRPHKHLSESMHGESVILRFLSETEEMGVIPSEISNEMQISSARIATTLNSLERKGLITRQIDVADRRRILVSLTQAGKEHAQHDIERIVSMTADMLRFLGERDAAEYVRITGRLAEMAFPLHETNHER